MTDPQDISGTREALRFLDDKQGQSLLTDTDCWGILLAFVAEVSDDFVAERLDDPDFTEGDSYPDGPRRLALSHALNERLESAESTRGVTAVLPHVRVASVADVTAILVEAIGEEPSTTTMRGAGGAADVRADENIETLTEALTIDPYT